MQLPCPHIFPSPRTVRFPRGQCSVLSALIPSSRTFRMPRGSRFGYTVRFPHAAERWYKLYSHKTTTVEAGVKQIEGNLGLVLTSRTLISRTVDDIREYIYLISAPINQTSLLLSNFTLSSNSTFVI
jgi:hypothetical protein